MIDALKHRLAGIVDLPPHWTIHAPAEDQLVLTRDGITRPSRLPTVFWSTVLLAYLAYVAGTGWRTGFGDTWIMLVPALAILGLLLIQSGPPRLRVDFVGLDSRNESISAHGFSGKQEVNLHRPYACINALQLRIPRQSGLHTSSRYSVTLSIAGEDDQDIVLECLGDQAHALYDALDGVLPAVVKRETLH